MKIILSKNKIAIITIGFAIITWLQISCKKNVQVIPTFVANALVDSNFNTQWQNLSNFITGQKAFALTLENGKILWLYSGSNINNKVAGKIPCNANAQNAGVLQYNNTFQLLNVNNTDFIPTISGNPFLPLCSFVYSDTIFIFGKTSINNNLYVAKYLYPSLTYMRTEIINQVAINSNTFQYGFGCVADTMLGFYYNYGIKKTTTDYQVVVARHPLDNPNKKWQYYTGTNWSDTSDFAKVILTTTNEPTCIRKLFKGFICLVQNTGDGCGKGLDISFKYSNYAVGPFEGDQKLYSIPYKWQNFSPNAIGACLQPSIIGNTTEKRVLITYSLNGFKTCANDCDAGFTNPDFYKTYGITVPLKTFNAGW